ncbi:uncharacterized protein BDR25DRAFT_396980 [Lindgomyces ingoldianus]|uniref:Uncharacterized protein n=1 Tax=Lindgomyces ingoldianus TaxID=673940 RepID=A0ACB6Q9X8_9PLEO|nr:uncharacterized protein BDR25DRAFT_396980 [Lindgomyces ingoldianus]KAF2463844.1 hypothetical protein BDR25DRAFT_396980 [Lindgomyces ingoldianus]
MWSTKDMRNWISWQQIMVTTHTTMMTTHPIMVTTHATMVTTHLTIVTMGPNAVGIHSEAYGSLLSCYPPILHSLSLRYVLRTVGHADRTVKRPAALFISTAISRAVEVCFSSICEGRMSKLLAELYIYKPSPPAQAPGRCGSAVLPASIIGGVRGPSVLDNQKLVESLEKPFYMVP